jgi:hypothetical protein
MVKIGRLKGDARQFAVSVGPLGNVTEWTPDEAKAVPVTPEVAEKVARHYDGRRNAGKIVFGDEKGRQARPPVEGPVDKPALPPLGQSPANGLTPNQKELAAFLELDEKTTPDALASEALGEIKAVGLAVDQERTANKVLRGELADAKAAHEQEVAKLRADLEAAAKQPDGGKPVNASTGQKKT